jgi:hypothetical protein
LVQNLVVFSRSDSSKLFKKILEQKRSETKRFFVDVNARNFQFA